MAAGDAGDAGDQLFALRGLSVVNPYDYKKYPRSIKRNIGSFLYGSKRAGGRQQERARGGGAGAAGGRSRSQYKGPAGRMAGADAGPANRGQEAVASACFWRAEPTPI